MAREPGRPASGLLGLWPLFKAAKPELDLDRTRLGKVVPEYLNCLGLAALAVPEPLSSGRVALRRGRNGDSTALVPWWRQDKLHTLDYPDHGYRLPPIRAVHVTVAIRVAYSIGDLSPAKKEEEHSHNQQWAKAA